MQRGQVYAVVVQAPIGLDMPQNNHFLPHFYFSIISVFIIRKENIRKFFKSDQLLGKGSDKENNFPNSEKLYK